MASHGGRGVPAVHSRLAPRPPLERATNQYVETPLPPRPPPPPLRPSLPPKPCRDVNFALVTLPVTTPPRKTSAAAVAASPGIMCAACGRCRCASCRTPRPLPACLCGPACLCSPSAAVDYATCMCLPKACAYHCSDEEDARPSWLCLGLSAVACPCLLCYVPCRKLLRLCEACHRLCTTPGCRCAPHVPLPRAYCPPEKRLLDSPE